MISPNLVWVALFLSGAMLGGVFYAGLWWTVHKATSAETPALWFAAGFVLRIALVMIGFYVIGAGGWRRMLACLAGFMVAHALTLVFARPALARASEIVRGATRAP